MPGPIPVPGPEPEPSPAPAPKPSPGADPGTPPAINPRPPPGVYPRPGKEAVLSRPIPSPVAPSPFPAEPVPPREFPAQAAPPPAIGKVVELTGTEAIGMPRPIVERAMAPGEPLSSPVPGPAMRRDCTAAHARFGPPGRPGLKGCESSPRLGRPETMGPPAVAFCGPVEPASSEPPPAPAFAPGAGSPISSGRSGIEAGKSGASHARRRSCRAGQLGPWTGKLLRSARFGARVG